MKSFKTIIESVRLAEKLSKSDPIDKWISDFVHSDDPKFNGKSKEERMKMAKGAYYGMQEEVDLDEDKAHIEQHLADKDINASVSGKTVKVHSSDVAATKKHLSKAGYDHKVVGGLNEDVEELDEISKETLSNYAHKAFADGNELHKQIDKETDPEQKAKLKAKLSQRNTGVIKAAKKMRNEEKEFVGFTEFLEEETKKPYIVISHVSDNTGTRADGEKVEKNRVATKLIATSPEHALQLSRAHHEKNGRKVHSANIKEAVDTVKKDAEGKVISWSHEGDWEKSSKKDKDGKGKVANLSDIARRKTEKLTKEELEEFMQTEAYEQLDELDKKTLGSYVSKSHDQLMKHTGTVNMKYGRGDKDATAYALDKDALRKTANRTQGMKTALNKLTKEEVEELDELDNHTAQISRYEKKYGSLSDSHKDLIRKGLGHMVHNAKNPNGPQAKSLPKNLNKEEVEESMMSEDFLSESEKKLAKLAADIEKRKGLLSLAAEKRKMSKNSRRHFRSNAEVNHENKLRDLQQQHYDLKKSMTEEVEESFTGQAKHLVKGIKRVLKGKDVASDAEANHLERSIKHNYASANASYAGNKEKSDAHSKQADRHTRTANRIGKLMNKVANEEVEDLEEKRGLWDNIHAKRKRIEAGSGEKMRKPGSEGAPTDQDLKNASEETEYQKKEKDELDLKLSKWKNQQRAEKALKKEDTMLTYKDFLETISESKIDDIKDRLAAAKEKRLDAYDFSKEKEKPKSNVTKHYAKYNSETDSDDKPEEPKEKRGRGRPAGSKSGARV